MAESSCSRSQLRQDDRRLNRTIFTRKIPQKILDHKKLLSDKTVSKKSQEGSISKKSQVQIRKQHHVCLSLQVLCTAGQRSHTAVRKVCVISTFRHQGKFFVFPNTHTHTLQRHTPPLPSLSVAPPTQQLANAPLT